MQKSVNGNSEHEGGTWLSVCAAAVKKRVKVGYAITLCLDAVSGWELVRCEYPPYRGTRVRTPQTAATPSPKANANPTRRPDSVLLLQPWSTALIQTRKSRMAKIASALSHID